MTRARVVQAARRLPILLAALPVHAYRRVVSPLLPPRCRYYPTCSAYALQSIHRYGAVRGAILATWRLLRCNPWSAGGVDLVADQRLLRGWLGRPRRAAERAVSRET